MKLTLAVAACFLTSVSAHGYVQQILFGSNLVDTWNPYKDPSKKPAGNKITRKFLDNGPVTDNLFTTDAMTCNFGAKGETNNVPTIITAPIAAGSKTARALGDVLKLYPHCLGQDLLSRVWRHAGPSVGFQEFAYSEQHMVRTLPSKVAAGEYILRHKILGLQRTNTDGSLAQFYPGCHQISVTGSGTTKLPTGIALPCAYQPTDTTSIFMGYRDISATNPYTAPGGQVWGDSGWSNLQNTAGT
ncbi:MAG: hypothetical protein MMC23_002018 [Stictis urceolatum]|nr:hypothetical protein [Stictis urceolata]